MTSQDHESVAERYLAKATRSAAGHCRLGPQELVWLLDHTTRLNGLRLELLRGLQAALPGHHDQDIADLKELLTDLIIMHSRSSGREGGPPPASGSGVGVLRGGGAGGGGRAEGWAHGGHGRLRAHQGCGRPVGSAHATPSRRRGARRAPFLHHREPRAKDLGME